MPPLSRYWIRCSLLALNLGWLIGGLMIAAKAFPSLAKIYLWRNAHIELLLMGWLTNLAFGVAYWIFPRVALSIRPRQAWAIYAFSALQLGTLISLSNTLAQISGILLLARCLQCSAFVAFAVHLYPRVRAFGAPYEKSRAAKGV